MKKGEVVEFPHEHSELFAGLAELRRQGRLYELASEGDSVTTHNAHPDPVPVNLRHGVGGFALWLNNSGIKPG